MSGDEVTLANTWHIHRADGEQIHGEFTFMGGGDEDKPDWTVADEQEPFEEATWIAEWFVELVWARSPGLDPVFGRQRVERTYHPFTSVDNDDGTATEVDAHWTEETT